VHDERGFIDGFQQFDFAFLPFNDSLLCPVLQSVELSFTGFTCLSVLKLVSALSPSPNQDAIRRQVS
jgi:hypothetical protein